MKNFFLSGMSGASDVAGSSLAEQISFIYQGGSASSDDLTSLSVNSSNRSNAIGDYAAVPSNAANELSAGSAFAFANIDAVVSDGVVAPGTDAANQSIDVKGTNFDDVLLGADIPGVRSFMAGLAGDNTLRGRSGFGVADYIDTPLSLVEGLTDGFFFASLAPVNNNSSMVVNPFGGTDTLINMRGISGTNGQDHLIGSAADEYFWGNGGSDIIDGGDGVDWVSYSRDPAGVSVNLAVKFASDGWGGADGSLGLGGRDVLFNIENVEGSSQDDVLIGDGGVNELSGLDGADLFKGLSGDDTIDGGAGDDTAIYRGLRSEYVIRKISDGVYTVQDKVAERDGTDRLSNVEHVTFSDETLAPGEAVKSVAPGDLDGDAASDILLQNGADGLCFVWEMEGLSVKASGVVGWTPPTNRWHAVGTGDFDGDGKSDILLQNGDDGMCFTWEMEGLNVNASGVVGWTPPSNAWHAVGTGDFDGDGKSDILLQNGDDGMCFAWEMDGLTVNASGVVGWTPPTNRWHAVGTGDFDGDGKSDILLQNGDDGMCFVWEMDGLTVKASGVVGWTPPTAAWRAVGTGDFNGDGRSDILLQNGDDGMCFVWEMEGLTVRDSGVVGWTPPTNRWHAVGTGDFDGDGKSDILLQNGDDGMCFVWEMDGLTVKASGVVGWTPPSADWHASV